MFSRNVKFIGLSAVTMFAALVAAGTAHAASLSLLCGGSTNCSGQDMTLPANFNPAGWSSPEGIHGGSGNTGTHVTLFTNSTSNSTSGLFVNPGSVDVTFTYLGFEAGDTDIADASFTLGQNLLFTNQTSPIATPSDQHSVTVTYTLGAGQFLLPFLFSDSSVGVTAYNGGPMQTGSGNYVTSVAYYLANTTTVYAFFDDGGAGPDSDYDDMVVKIEVSPSSNVATPLPAALPLFASGLGAIGLAGWRRKRKAALAV